ncbi:hypothetical protein [Pleurocapsa sp. PCC 7319]|uniref:hypothetical protein n=1 Tax=Pleurocapsa sp. PCC 7319 TaxID=118161 RepID=UPI00034918F6|nr:hypothetical protein [Pleurocapsa sp. PCC 7319]
MRLQAIRAIALLVADNGKLLVITRHREPNYSIPEGPPWPMSDEELSQFKELGLDEIRRDSFLEGDEVIVKQLRIEYCRHL